MPNNSYVLNNTVQSFLRPSNTTAYGAFTIVTNNSPLILPAPVSDRPFYIRYIRVQVLPGLASNLSSFLYIYNADPTGLTSFTDGAFANYVPTAAMIKSRLAFTLLGNPNISFLDIPVPANLSLSCPTGVFAFNIEVNAAFTPSASQKFTFEVVTEYAN